MEPNEHIREIVRTIVEHVQPEKILLFGSHARGQATPESDVDLLVVADMAGRRRERNRRVRGLFPCRRFGLDVFVYTPREFESQRGLVNSLGAIADREGVVVYER